MAGTMNDCDPEWCRALTPGYFIAAFQAALKSADVMKK
jgi:hypothetical protein